MSYPVPSIDPAEKKYPSEDYNAVRKGAVKKKAMAKKMSARKEFDKQFEFPLQKLKRLVNESKHLRQHPFGSHKNPKDDPHHDDNGYDQIAQG